MENVKWLKDCEICNTGLCSQVQQYIKEGMSEREASRQMELDCDGIWTADKIRDRYRYYVKGHAGGKTPKDSEYENRPDDLYEEEQAEGERQRKEHRENVKRRYDEKVQELTSKYVDVEGSSKEANFVNQAINLLSNDQRKPIAKRIYRIFAKALHPDTGGTVEKMQKLNSLRDEMMESGNDLF